MAEHAGAPKQGGGRPPDASASAPGAGAGETGQPAHDSTAPALSSAPTAMTPASLLLLTPADLMEWRRSAAREALTVETSAQAWARAYRGRASSIRAIGLYLALTSAVVATIAGATGLAVTGALGAWLALAAAVLTAISATVGAPARAESERSIAAKNWVLAAEARVFRTTVVGYAAPAEALAAFRQLCKQRDDVWSAAPVEGSSVQHSVDTLIDKTVYKGDDKSQLYSDKNPFGYVSAPLKGRQRGQAGDHR